jgi:hypothetical protein
VDLKYADEWYCGEGMYHRPQRSFAMNKRCGDMGGGSTDEGQVGEVS